MIVTFEYFINLKGKIYLNYNKIRDIYSFIDLQIRSLQFNSIQNIKIKMITRVNNKSKKFITTDQDDNDSLLSYSPTQQKNKKKKNKKSETKNIVLNYRTIIKHILNQALHPSSPYHYYKNQIILMIKYMDSSTNIEMLRESLKNELFTQILQQSKQNGKFLRFIQESGMLIENKLYCIKFFNVLLNGMKNANSLLRWKPLKSQGTIKERVIQKQMTQYDLTCDQSGEWRQQNMDKLRNSFELHEYQLDMQLEKYDRPLLLKISSNDPDVKFAMN